MIVKNIREVMRMDTPVISFIGWSGVGKTTFLEKVIAVLKARGVRLALIKQDGHEFDMDKEGKDTWRFSKAGADVVTIANKKHAAVMLNRPTEISEIIKIISDVDLIITEGYHELSYPQIEVHRACFGKLRCEDEKNLIALVTDEKLPNDVPQFSFEDIGKTADLIQSFAGLDTECAAEYRSLKSGEKKQDDSVRVFIDEKETLMVPFVQDIIREVNCGVLKTLRDSDISSGSEITVRIKL